MTQFGMYGERKPEPSGNPLGFALGIFLVCRLYFTVYPSSHHKSDTVLMVFMEKPQALPLDQGELGQEFVC